MKISLLLLLLPTVASFVVPTSPSARLQRRQRSLPATDKEQEIADLERKLQELKDSSTTDDDDDDPAQPVWDRPTNSPNQMEDPIEEMLTERWKEEESPSGGVGQIIGTVVAVVVGLVGLTAFSQVPVGVDGYTKYSAVKTSATQIDLGDLNEARKSATEGL